MHLCDALDRDDGERKPPTYDDCQRCERLGCKGHVGHADSPSDDTPAVTVHSKLRCQLCWAKLEDVNSYTWFPARDIDMEIYSEAKSLYLCNACLTHVHTEIHRNTEDSPNG